MDSVAQALSFLDNLDQWLVGLFAEYGAWVYLGLFLFVFMESTVTPFLPGDSVIFAVGIAASVGGASLTWLWVLFIIAAILGTMTSYSLGKRVGPSAFKEDRRFLNAEQLDHARHFFDRYGPQTLAVGRFVPVVRTFAPVVAGILRMPYSRFLGYTAVGIVLWVTVLLVAGYFVESVPILRARVGIVVVLVFILSLGPVVIEWFWDHIGRRSYRAILRRIGITR